MLVDGVTGGASGLVWCVEDPAASDHAGEARLTRYRRVRDTLRALIAEELGQGGLP